MGVALAAADRRRTAGPRRAAKRDALSQSRLHPEKPPGGGRHRRCREPGRFRSVRTASDGAVETVSGPARLRGLRRGARAAPVRAADLLRDLTSLTRCPPFGQAGCLYPAQILSLIHI